MTALNSITATQQRFILHWGEMGNRWGINRTVAQIHALLFISERPLHAEQIAEVLSVARSNVSNSLRELQGWGIVKVVHVMGDRRDHFESLKDVWAMFQLIMDERKKREADPTLQMLRECVERKPAGAADAYSHERLTEMLAFFESMSAWYDNARRLPGGGLIKLFQLGGKASRLLRRK